jgi:hypothetical protein
LMVKSLKLRPGEITIGNELGDLVIGGESRSFSQRINHSLGNSQAEE